MPQIASLVKETLCRNMSTLNLKCVRMFNYEAFASELLDNVEIFFLSSILVSGHQRIFPCEHL